jgi:hypothetical protein
MCERTGDAAELSRLLMTVCDQNLGYLRGAISAADAISDLLFEQAEENHVIYNTNRGLRWALQEATAAVEETNADLQRAHLLARELAGEVTPKARLAELAATGAPETEAGDGEAPARDVARAVIDEMQALHREAIGLVRELADRIAKLEAAREPEPAGEARP